jgi:uncharacterized membrane protein YgdD (TMEM256/DUF423 family)
MGPVAWLRIGAMAGFLAVGLGAFGAHGLRDRLKPAVSDTPEEAAFKLRRIENFETASRYNMAHALALIAVGMLLLSGRSSLALTIAGWAFVAGIVLFSGSLYAYGFTGLRWLGAVTPFGGLGFLIGWLALAVGAGAAVRGILPSPME